jgi:hypothetical protein
MAVSLDSKLAYAKRKLLVAIALCTHVDTTQQPTLLISPITYKKDINLRT